MLNNLLKVTKNVISKCVKPVLESAKKAFQPQIKNLQNSTLGKAAAKLLPVVNSPAVKSGFSQVQKALALPKTVAPAKKEVASTPQSSSNNQAKQLSASSNSPAPQEENVKLLEEYKGNEASKLEDIIRGAVKSDAFRIAFNANLSMGAMPGFLKVLRVMTPPEYKSLNLKIPYELLKADIKAKFNQAGNDAYNAQVPIASNLIGAFTNSSDYKEHGPLPLETPEMNNMLAMMNYFMYGGRGGGILNQADVMSTYQNITNNTNMASVIGANAGGALIDGGAGMANSIIEIIIDPYEAEKNLFDLVIKSPVIIPALLDKAANYTKHYVTEATPQEKARVKGRIIFELASLAAFSAIGKAIKGAEAAQGAQKTEALAKTGSEVSALIDEGGVSITKTEDVLTANRGVGEVLEEGVKKGSGNAGKVGEAIEGASINDSTIITDYYVAPNGKTLPGQYKAWLGENMRDSLMNSVSDPTLKKAIGEVFRPGSIIGDGGTADIIKFEKETGILLSKSGHIQKGIDMSKYFQKLIDSATLSSADTKVAQDILNSFKSVLGGK